MKPGNGISGSRTITWSDEPCAPPSTTRKRNSDHDDDEAEHEIRTERARPRCIRAARGHDNARYPEDEAQGAAGSS
jgi:hypothetical protein